MIIPYPFPHAVTIHIVVDDPAEWEKPITRVRALCGKEALIFDDGYPTPLDFDFVDYPDDLRLCDCLPCMAKDLAMQATTKARVPA